MRIVNLNTPEVDTWQKPKMLFVYTTQAFDPAQMRLLRERFPEIIVIGISSSHGIILSKEFRRGTFGILAEEADAIPMRAMAVDFTDTDNIRQKVSTALSPWTADTSGLANIYIHATPGTEERIIEGIQDAFHQNAKIFGATCGHDRFLPKGFCFLNDTWLTNGVIIMQLLDERVLCSITCGGYLSTPHHGIVTSASGRILETIDNKPAAEVYDEWTAGMFSAYIHRGGTLPPSIGLYPFGRTLENEPECGFWLSHPYLVDSEKKSIALYAEIPVGATIQLMRGTAESTKTYIATAIRQALSQANDHEVVAAIIMYCAGCASVIPNDMNSVCEHAAEAFGKIPFIGCTTFGEQGRLHNASQNYHGNMMIEIALVLAN